MNLSISPMLLETWKLISLTAACATLPGSVELLVLSAASMLPRRSDPSIGTSPWRVAIVIPAHNEATGIASCVKSLLAAERQDMNVEIYVIADNCTDNTATLACSAGANVLTRTNDKERGKGHALHFAFMSLAPLGFDCVLIVDADSVVASNFIVEAAGAMRNGADAVQTRYLVRNMEEGTRARLMGLALRAFNILRLMGRDRLGLSAGLLGNGFGLRSETVQAVPYLASSVVEDLEYHLSLVDSGRRVRFVESTMVFGEMPVRGKGVETQRSRWEGGRLRMMLEKIPVLLLKVIRGKFAFLEPLLELLLLPLAFHVTLLLIALSAPQRTVRDIGIFGIFIVLLHLLATIKVGGGDWRDLSTLAVAPFYILWKLMLIPSMLRSSRSNSAWVRTSRTAEAESIEKPFTPI